VRCKSRLLTIYQIRRCHVLDHDLNIHRREHRKRLSSEAHGVMSHDSVSRILTAGRTSDLLLRCELNFTTQSPYEAATSPSAGEKITKPFIEPGCSRKLYAGQVSVFRFLSVTLLARDGDLKQKIETFNYTGDTIMRTWEGKYGRICYAVSGPNLLYGRGTGIVTEQCELDSR
jgi:hypothetical protein